MRPLRQNKPKQQFLMNSSGSMLVFFTLGLMLLLSLLSGCGAGQSASAFPTARPTKTWTPLATLTPLATYTPSVTPLPTETPPPDMPTRAPPPTIPAIGADVLAQLRDARRKANAQAPNVQAPSVALQSSQPSIGGYEGEETACCKWPVSGRITSNVTANHVALDIATTLGTPVLAADEGRVVAAGWDDSGYGYRVIVNHGQGLQTLYAHLSNYPVEVGDDVNQGQMIGQIGSTGRSTGPHLHFEVRYYGRRIDPWDLLP